jgi:hypothetical protein
MGYWTDVAAKSGNNAKPLSTGDTGAGKSATAAYYSDDFSADEKAALSSPMASPVSDGAVEATPNVEDGKFWTGVAAPNPGAKSIADYKSTSTQSATYQLNGEPDVRVVTPTPNNDGKAILAANPKGTDKENISRRVTLASKRFFPGTNRSADQSDKYNLGNQLK